MVGVESVQQVEEEEYEERVKKPVVKVGMLSNVSSAPEQCKFKIASKRHGCPHEHG